MNHDHDQHEHAMPKKRALDPTGHSIKDYMPLIVVFGFVGISSVAHVAAWGGGFEHWMAAIMG